MIICCGSNCYCSNNEGTPQKSVWFSCSRGWQLRAFFSFHRPLLRSLIHFIYTRSGADRLHHRTPKCLSSLYDGDGPLRNRRWTHGTQTQGDTENQEGWGWGIQSERACAADWTCYREQMERTTDQAVEATFLSILNTLQASFFLFRVD